MKNFIVLAVGGSTRITCVVEVENKRPVVSNEPFSTTMYQRAHFWDTCMAVMNRLQRSERFIKGDKCFNLYDLSNNSYIDLCSAYKDLSNGKDDLMKVFVNMHLTPFLLINWLFFGDTSFNDKNFWQLEHTFEEFVTQSIIPLQVPEFIKVMKKVETSENKVETPTNKQNVEVKNEVETLKNEVETLKNEVETLKNEVETLKNHVQNNKYHLLDIKTEVQNMKTVKKNVPFFDNQVIRTEVKAVKQTETETFENDTKVVKNENETEVVKNDTEVVKNETEVVFNVQDEEEAKKVTEPLFEDWTSVPNHDEDNDHASSSAASKVTPPKEDQSVKVEVNQIQCPSQPKSDKDYAEQCENLIQKVVNLENPKVIDGVKELNELFTKMVRVFEGIVAHI